MTVWAHQNKPWTWQELLDVAKAMPLREQIRLHTELGKLVQVHLVQPDSSTEAMQQGQRLADEVRHELATSLSGSSLEETMASLRGRSW